MCSTCNYKNFETVMVNGTTKLQSNLGVGKMVIRCDVTGRNWELGVKDDDRDRFTLYACPTCGKKLRQYMICGECPKRIVKGYKDIEENCRYVRCSFKPEWRQMKNSSPKWCPLKNGKC